MDLTDFPGSVWPNILDLLGKNKKILLVGNKVMEFIFYFRGSSVGECLERLIAVLGVDDSSLLTASQRCDELNSPYA